MARLTQCQKGDANQRNIWFFVCRRNKAGLINLQNRKKNSIFERNRFTFCFLLYAPAHWRNIRVHRQKVNEFFLESFVVVCDKKNAVGYGRAMSCHIAMRNALNVEWMKNKWFWKLIHTFPPLAEFSNFFT